MSYPGLLYINNPGCLYFYELIASTLWQKSYWPNPFEKTLGHSQKHSVFYGKIFSHKILMISSQYNMSKKTRSIFIYTIPQFIKTGQNPWTFCIGCCGSLSYKSDILTLPPPAWRIRVSIILTLSSMGKLRGWKLKRKFHMGIRNRNGIRNQEWVA